MKSLRIIIYAFVFSPALTLAEEKESNCRCCRVNQVHAPYLKQLPAPDIIYPEAPCQFKITTSSPKAQSWFNQGLSHLHGFWEFEAYRCFLQALKYDPDCAMAYWGVGMSLPGKKPESSKERASALDSALNLFPKITETERLYIQSLQSLIKGGTSLAAKDLEKLLVIQPDEPNATAFLAYWLRDDYDDTGQPGKGTARGLKLIDDALKKNPNHLGLLHYQIHLLEPGPQHDEASAAAATLVKLAPLSGHLQHMPGHLHYLAGRYSKAKTAFERCLEIETAYHKTQKIIPIDNTNYLHNLHFLTFAHLELGQIEQAQKTSKLMASHTIPEERKKADGSAFLSYYGAVIRAFVPLHVADYDKALSVLNEYEPPKESAPYFLISALKEYCSAKIKITTNKPQEALEHVTKLNEYYFEYTSHTSSEPDSVERYSWLKNKLVLSILKSELTAWTKSNPSLQISVAVHKQNSSAYIEPPYLPWPIEEEIGRLMLFKKNPAEAKEWFMKALEIRKNSAGSLLGLARAHHLLGDTQQAYKYYELFTTSWKDADPDRPELIEAKSYLAFRAQ